MKIQHNNGLTLRLTIEQAQSDEAPRTVVFKNVREMTLEDELKRTLLIEALKKLQASPKAIHRHSGGISPAQSTQLMVFSPTESPEAESEVRIRVKFMDFKRVSGQPIQEERYCFLTKDVLPEQLIEYSSSEILSEPRHVIDFGYGIVPVFIFQIKMDPNGHQQILFTEHSPVRKILRGANTARIPLQCYKAFQGVLRLASESEFAEAIQRERNLRALGKQITPLCLKIGKPMLAASGISEQALRQSLRDDITRLYAEVQPDDEIVNYMEGLE